MKKSDKRYEIDVLLSMARITDDSKKKKEYLNRIELILESGDESSNVQTASQKFNDPEILDVINGFIDSCGGRKNLIGERTDSVYNRFLEYCIEENAIQISKIMYGKYFNQCSNLHPIQIKRNGEHYRIYKE